MTTLLLTEAQFKQYAPVSTNVTVTSPLSQVIEDAQEAWIRPVWGQALYDAVQTMSQPGPLTAPYQALVDYTKPCLAYYVLYQALPWFFAKNREQGPVNQLSTTGDVVSLQELTYLRKEALATAERKALFVKKFLEANAADYPEYESSCTECAGGSPVRPVNRFGFITI